ncbi:MAG: HindIII family type II restriction endonuclease [Anaerolineae bacterium]|nr:HindIII family type II restriction endonuclease [Anaerolineae bacterium]
MRKKIISLIYTIVKQDNAFELLEDELMQMDDDTFSQILLTCGAIPEEFNHDSSEEKLWAKSCDVLLAMAWNKLGIKSEVLRVPR